jgi:hypothetical protein
VLKAPGASDKDATFKVLCWRRLFLEAYAELRRVMERLAKLEKERLVLPHKYV